RCEDAAGNFTCRLDESGRLVQEWYFGTTPEARQAASLYRDRVLRGASIGFVSDGVEDVPVAEAEQLYGVKKRLKRHVGGELVETSAVPVPSCPGALALGWVDAPAAAAMARRGVLGGLVTKAFAPYPRLAQASRRGKMAGSKPKVRKVRRTAGAKPVSTTATDTTAKADDAAEVTKAADEVVAKDAAATDEQPTGDTDDPHADVMMGLQSAMHSAVDKYCSGTMTKEEAHGLIGGYMDDHAR